MLSGHSQDQLHVSACCLCLVKRDGGMLTTPAPETLPVYVAIKHVCSFHPWLLTWLLRSSGLLTARGCLEEVLALVWPGRRCCCYLSYNTSPSSSFLGWMLLFFLFAYLLRIWIFFPLDYCEKGCFGCGSSNNLFRTFMLYFAYLETIVESYIMWVIFYFKNLVESFTFTLSETSQIYLLLTIHTALCPFSLLNPIRSFCAAQFHRCVVSTEYCWLTARG